MPVQRQGDAHKGLGSQQRAAGDGYDGGGAEMTDNAVLAFGFVPVLGRRCVGCTGSA